MQVNGWHGDEWCQNIFAERWTKKERQALFPAGTTIKNIHNCKYPTSREKDIKPHRVWVQTLLDEVAP